jgi:hypothetical protein
MARQCIGSNPGEYRMVPRRRGMRPRLLLAALCAACALATNMADAKPHQATAPGIVKPVPRNTMGTAGLVHGPIGGPSNRGFGINGTGMPRKLSKK